MRKVQTEKRYFIMHARLLLVVLAGAFASSLIAAPAHAQRARTFVASYGVDGNSCSFTQPCRTFQAAYNNTAVGGEVTAIDSAGFGALSIGHSITITSPTGVEAGIVPPQGGDAIDIVAGSNDVVVLRGLTLEGGGGLNGGAGINFFSGGNLEILDCVIKDFFDGVLVKPSSNNSGSTVLTIKNTKALNNGNAGIYLTPRGSYYLAASIDEVTADRNNYGMYFDASPLQAPGLITVMLSRSHVAYNVTQGIVENGGSVVVSATIKNVLSTENGYGGNGNGIALDLLVSGPSASVITVLVDHNTFDTVQINDSTSTYSDGTNNVIQQLSGGSFVAMPPK